MYKILLDLDGVIADYYQHFSSFLNKNYNLNLNCLAEPFEYDMCKWNTGLTISQLNDASKKWIIDHGFKKLPIYDNAVNFVEKLNKLGEVFIVTARIGDFNIGFSDKVKKQIINDTITWLKYNNIYYKHLCFENNKIDFCKKNNINIVIEDKLSTIEKMLDYNNIYTFLINRNWNQNNINNDFHFNVDNYNDIITILNNHCKRG